MLNQSVQKTARWLVALIGGALLASEPGSRGDVTTFVTTNLTTFNVGTVSGGTQDGQVLHATNAVHFIQQSSGPLQIGGIFNGAGGNNNAVTISNATLTTSGAYSVIGSSSTNNSLTILSNTVWSATTGLIVGYGTGGSANLLTVNGGSINISGNELDIGWGSDASNNGVIVTNGGQLTTTALYMGAGAAANNNYLIVAGAKTALTNNGSMFMAGTSAGGSSNQVTVASGARLVNAGVFYTGYISGGNEQVTVSDTGSLFQVNSTFYLGYQGIGGNQFVVSNGAVAIDQGGIIGSYLGSGAVPVSNSVVVTGAGSTWSNVGAIAVGNNASANFNSVTITNGAKAYSTTASIVGNSGSSNSVTVAGNGAIWNVGGATLTIGSSGAGSAVGNSVVIGAGGSITNVAGLNVGVTGSSANNNSLIGSNGSYFMTSGNVLIGSGGNNNTVVLSNSVLTTASGYNYIGNGFNNNSLTLLSNSVWNTGGGIVVGFNLSGAASTNQLTVNGTIVKITGNEMDIGWGATASANSVTVTNGGAITTPGIFIGAGAAANNNNLTVAGTGSFVTNSSTLYISGQSVGGLSNSVTVAGGGRMFNSGIMYNGFAGGGGNVINVTDPGSVLQSPASLQMLTGSNQLNISNGGVVINNGATLSPAGATFNKVLVTGAGSTWSNTGGLIINGNQNSVIATNGGALYGTGSISYNYTASSTVFGDTIVMGGGNWNLNGNPFAVGGTATDPATGTSGNSSNNSFISLGGTVTNANALIVGGVFGENSTGNNFNTVTFTNGGGLFMTTAGNIMIGAGRAIQTGGNNNTVILSNSVLLGGGGAGIGAGSSNNILTLLPNSVWNNGGNALGIGLNISSQAGVSNILTVSGAVLSNFSSVTVGSGAGSSSNQLLINNGGKLFMTAGLTVGGSGANNNSVTVSGGSILSNINGLAVGGNQTSVVASNGGAIFGKGALSITAASGQYGDTVNLGNGAWDLQNSGSLIVGGGFNVTIYNNSSNNTFMGGTVTNAIGLAVGATWGNSSSGNNFNTVVFTNAGGGFYMNSGYFEVGGGRAIQFGGNNNTVILSNSVVNVVGNFTEVGGGSSNNILTLLGNTVFNNGGSGLGIGDNISSQAGVSNSMTIDGGVMTNVGQINVGTGGRSASNQLIVTGGGMITNFSGFKVGTASGANYNSIIATNGLMLGATNAGPVLVGSSGLGVGGGNNTVIITGSNGIMASTGIISIGNGSSNNVLTLLKSGIWNANGGTLQIGVGAAYNNVVTLDGTILTNLYTQGGPNNGLFVGTGAGGAISNQLILQNGAVISNVSGLVVGGAAGANYNQLIATNNAGGIYMLDNGNTGNILVGSGGGVVGGGNNTVILSNSALVTRNQFNEIGYGSSNNTLTLLGSSWNAGFQQPTALTLGFGAAASNSLVLDSTIVSNLSGIALGSGVAAFGNQLLVYGSGVLTNFGALSIGGNQNSVIVTNGGKIFSTGAINFNSTAGYGNTFTMGGGLWNLNGNAVNVGSTTGFSNDAFNVVGGTVTNAAGLWVSGGNQSAITSGDGGNSFIVTNGGKFYMVSGSVSIGSGYFGNAAGGNNTVILSNSSLIASDISSIGSGSSNNIVTLLANTIWNQGNQAFYLGWSGQGLQAASNTLMINGGTLTNVNAGTISGNANSLTVTNGGAFYSGALNISVNANSASNSYNLIGGGAMVTASNGLITLGGSGGGGFNTMTVSNANAWASGLTIGAGASNNTVTVLSNTTWNLIGNTITVGSGAGTGNVMTVNSGGLVTNVGGLTVGSGAGANGNSFIVTNGGGLGISTGRILIGYLGGNNNIAVLSNGVLNTTAGAVGLASSYNSLTILSNTLWNVNGLIDIGGGEPSDIVAGNTWGTGNVLTVKGGILTNFTGVNNALSIQGLSNQLVISAGGKVALGTGAGNLLRVADTTTSGGNSNLILVTDPGSVLSIPQYLELGATGNNSFNSLIASNGALLSLGAAYLGDTGQGNSILVTGTGTVLQAGNSSFSFGNILAIGYREASVSNSLTVANGGLVVNTGTMAIGLGASASGANYNSVTVSGPGSIFTNTGIVNVGSAGNSFNSLTVSNGGVFIGGGALTVGGGNNNSVLVTAGSLLRDNTLTIGAGTGNTISNVGGMYQFTAAPTISAGSGIISLNNGTIAYLGTGSADVRQTAVNGINFSGVNTFELNGASNTATPAGSQNYTFQVVAGNPTNYVNLMMINGQTAYGNGNFTIGPTGSLLVSNTMAAMTGTVTNQGGATFINSVGTFSANVYNAATGLWYMDPTTNNIAGNLDNAGGMFLTNSVNIVGGNLINEATGNYSMLQTSATYAAGVFTNLGTLAIYQASVLTNGNAFVGGSSTTIVSDIGSVWSNAQLVIGNSGSFAGVTVSNGGKLYATAAATIGLTAGGSNSVLVSGTGSVFSAGTTLALGPGASGLGSSSYNSLTVSNGGAVTVAGGIFLGSTAFNGGNNNSILVTGAGSVLSNLSFSSSIYVGGNSFGSLVTYNNNVTVAAGGMVYDGSTAGNWIGPNSGGTNSIVVTGSGSVWQSFGPLFISASGNSIENSLIISNGGKFIDTAALIGWNNSYSNSALVTGANSIWTNAGVLNMGTGNAAGGGYGNTLTITNSGSVFATAMNIGAYSASSNNTVTVTGPASVLNLSSTLIVGGSAGGVSNQLFVNNGASLFSGAATIGNGASGNSVVLSNGTWNLSGQTLAIGSGSAFNNSLTVNAGLVTNISTLTFAAGTNALTLRNAGQVYESGNGTTATKSQILITDPGSLWKVGGTFLLVSGNGASILVSNGGALTVGASMDVGGSSNSIHVTGAGSIGKTLAVNGTAIGDGGGGFNNLTIDNGGSWVEAGNFTVGNASGGSNSVLVSGSGSVLSNLSGTLIIGQSTGIGNTLVISNGGLVYDISSQWGNGSTGRSNTVTVTGAGSIWTNTANMNIGFTASYESLNIQNSGKVFATTAFIGGGSGAAGVGSFNLVTLADTGSLWQMSGGLTLGNGSAGNIGANNNQLIVSNGATLITGALTIGNFSGDNSNSVTIVSATSSNNGLITVGLAGSSFNTMTVSNGLISSQGLTLGNGSSNDVISVQGTSTWNLRQGALTWTAGSGTGNQFIVASSAVITNIGGINMGDAGTTLALTNNNLWLTTGGALNVGTVAGQGNNTLLLSNQTYTAGAVASTIGSGSSNNLLSLFGSTAWSNNNQNITVGSGAATGNVLLISSAALTNVNVLTVGTGAATGNSLVISNSMVALTKLVANTGNTVSFGGGTLTVGGMVISNGMDFTAGDGTQAATLQLAGGTHSFQNNLIITNNGTLAGTGSLVLNNGAGKAVIAGGGLLSPGTGGPAVITNTGTLEWDGGGAYTWQINSLAGAAGAATGWDFAAVSGTLVIAATGASPFTINAQTLTLSNNAAGVLNNFNTDGSYGFTIATAAGGISGFSPAAFTLNLSGIQNPSDGLWSLQQSNNSVVLNYQGVTNFVWSDTTGAFGTAGKWTGNATPALNQTNVVLYFGGILSQQYTATNDLTGLITKRIILTNNSTAVQTITGNSLGLAGLAPEIQQDGAGGFIIANNLSLSTNAFFDGTGAGQVTVAGQISGAASVTKTGSYDLVLSGSNTYTGATIIQQGRVLDANANALAATAVSNLVNGGLVFTNLTAATLGGLNGSGSILLANTAGAGVALTISGGGTYTGSLSGSGSLTKAGGAGLTLTGNNTYTGDTLVNAGGVLTVTGSLGSTNLVINNGGLFNWSSVTALTNVSTVTITDGGAFVLNNDGTIGILTGFGAGGQLALVSRTLQVGYGDGSSNYAARITGSGTLSKIGAGTLTINGGGVNTLGDLAANGGWLVVSDATVNATGNGSGSGLLVNNGGTFQLDSGGTVLASNLAVNPGGVLVFNGGTLAAVNATVNNGAVLNVGNGTNTAAYVAAGGLHSFANGLSINSNATLSGSGTLSGLVVINAGAIQSPGSSGAAGTLNVTGTNVWNGGGRYLVTVTDFSVPNQQGINWDLLAVNGLLSNNATAGKPFVIDVSSTAGGNFSKDGNYALTIATASGGVVNYAAGDFSIATGNLQNAYDGSFALSLQGNNLVLTYQGVTNFVWADGNGAFSGGGNWIAGNQPPVGTTNVVMYFGGTSAQQYTANNDLVNLFTKRIVLTNSSSLVQTITGNAFTLLGVLPEVQQNGSGAFVFANNLALGAGTLFDGTGTGTVSLNGQLSGNSSVSLTKTGTYALVLGGNNSGFSGTTIIAQGRVVAAHANALSASLVSNLVDGGLTFSNLTAATLGGLAGNGNIGLSNTAGAAVNLTLNGGGLYSGALSGNGSLTKAGSGTEVFTGNNLYTGDTVVNGGTLTVTGSLASTNLIVNSGGTFNWANATALTNTSVAAVNGSGLLNFQNSGTLAAIVGSGRAAVAGGAVATVGFGDGMTNFSGTLSGAGTLAKTGSGTLTWDGNAAISVANVLVEAGTLAFSGNAAAAGGNYAVSNSTLTVGGNAAATLSSLLVSNGAAIVNSGTLAVTGGLQVLTGGTLALNGGRLASGGTVYSNGTDFVVGNGSSAATFAALTGSHAFQQDLLVTSNGTLAGTGTITVNSGAGRVVLQSGAVLSPGTGAAGSGPGTLSLNGTLTGSGGGTYLFQVNDFNGTAGAAPGWDLAQINGVLAFAATPLNPFTVDVNSLNPGSNLPGTAANFDRDGNYTLTIATAAGGITGFSAAAVNLVLRNFATAYDGSWSLQLAPGATSLLLEYEGSTNFVWQNTGGNFSGAANWIVNATPPVAATNVVLYFGGTGSQQYTAANDLVNLITKRIVLTNSSSQSQTITGNALTLAGLVPEIQQNGAGGFVINNDLSLATNTFFDGSGSGTVIVNGQLSGTASLTKTGTYALVLGGVSTFTGPAIIAQGQLLLANANALAAVTVSNLVNNGLGFTNLTAATIGGLTGSGNILLANTAGQAVGLTVSGGGTYTGSLSGNGSLTKAGSAALTLTGNNLYTGDTLVNGGQLTVTGSLASTNLVINSGGVFNWSSLTALTNLSTVTIADGGVFLLHNDGTIGILTGFGSGGQLNLVSGTLQVGYGDGSSNYAARISGAGTLSKVGAGTLTINGGGVNSMGALAVNGGWLVVTDATVNVTGNGAASALSVNNGGTFELDAGTVAATQLQAAPGGTLVFNSGTLVVGGAAVSNGMDFVTGNGVNAATFTVAGGATAFFQQNLIVTNHGVLKGSGTIVAAGGQGNVVIQPGGVLSPGSSPGTLTIIGTNLWQGGGSYQFEVNDLNGSQGNNPGWDWVNIIGVLSNGASAGNPFVVALTSLNGSVAGAAANFNYNANYTMVVATASSVAGFDPASITLSTAAFQNAFDGVFALSLQGGTNVVLTYTGLNAYTWKDLSGNFSTGAAWEQGSAPGTGLTNVALYFGGSAAGAYTANNDLSGLVTKLVTLTNASGTVQTLAGNSFTFAGLTPELDQNGSGGFVISNGLALAVNTLLAGAGSGTVALDGTISGSGGLTKNGSWTLVLGGSNTASGVTTIAAGKVLVANTYALAGSTLSNLVAGGVVFTNITTASLGGLAGTVDLGLTNAAGAAVALAVGGNNQNSAYSGVLNGAGSLTKTGNGTLVLAATNTYTGGTVVNNGTLTAGSLANGIGGSGSSLGAGTVTIAGGTLRFGVSALLRVTNSVSGSVLLDGGTLNAAEYVNLGESAAIGNTTTITSDLLNLAGGSLDVTGGNVVVRGNIYNSGLITNSNGATLAAGSGSGVLSNAATGTIVLAGGNLAAALITNNGTVSGYGSLLAGVYNNQSVLATNGTLQLTGVAQGAGTYQAGAGATLSFAGGGTISTLVTTGGTVQVAAGVLQNNGVFANAGTLALAGGTYQTPLVLTNQSTGTIFGGGTINAGATLVNQGTLLADVGAQALVINPNLVNNGYLGLLFGGKLQVNGVFTNNGTLQAVSGAGTYSSAVVNNGLWLTDSASPGWFAGDLLVTTNGAIVAGQSLYVLAGNLINQSTNQTVWNTLSTSPGTNTAGSGTKFLFSGSGLNHTQYFETAGLQLSGGFTGSPSPPATGVQDVSAFSNVTGFVDNYALGQLWLTNTTLVLSGPAPGALFVNDLDLSGSAQLVISNNLEVYFVNSNDWSLANITLLGNAGIHQLVAPAGLMSVVPEPNVLLLWLAGAATLWAARRRRTSV